MVPELKEKAEQSRYSLGHKDHWPLSPFTLHLPLTGDLLLPSNRPPTRSLLTLSSTLV